MSSRLPGAQTERLFNAVLGAYSKEELQRLLWFNLDTDLCHVVPDDSLASIVFGLIRHLDRVGEVDRFLTAIEKDRPRNQAVQQAISDLRELDAKRLVAADQPATPDLSHRLRQFPPGPMVPFDWIPRSLVTQFATYFFNAGEAKRAVLDAIRERLDCDPDVNTITLPGLLNPGEVGHIAFWGDAFTKACPHGPRMVGALVFLIPEELFPAPARTDRTRLLERLKKMK